MQHENNRHNEMADGKATPQQVNAKSEEQAKQKTEPLDQNDKNPTDQDEGRMNNGETGVSSDNVN